MRILGIDMASQDARTAACVLGVRGGRLIVESVEVGCSNATLAALARESDWVGIDAPFGWPEPFVDAVSAWRSGRPWPGSDDEAAEPWRRSMSMRRTDEVVRARTGKVPLSVSSDKIAYVAMRTAHLLSLLGAASDELGIWHVERGPRVVEVYPGGTLRVIGVDARGYKRADGHDVRERVLGQVAERWPQLELGAVGEQLCASDHALDAFISALTAWCVSEGRTWLPDDGDLRARSEGWIHLPR